MNSIVAESLSEIATLILLVHQKYLVTSSAATQGGVLYSLLLFLRDSKLEHFASLDEVEAYRRNVTCGSSVRMNHDSFYKWLRLLATSIYSDDGDDRRAFHHLLVEAILPFAANINSSCSSDCGILSVEDGKSHIVTPSMLEVVSVFFDFLKVFYVASSVDSKVPQQRRLAPILSFWSLYGEHRDSLHNISVSLSDLSRHLYALGLDMYASMDIKELQAFLSHLKGRLMREETDSADSLSFTSFILLLEFMGRRVSLNDAQLLQCEVFDSGLLKLIVAILPRLLSSALQRFNIESCVGRVSIGSLLWISREAGLMQVKEHADLFWVYREMLGLVASVNAGSSAVVHANDVPVDRIPDILSQLVGQYVSMKTVGSMTCPGNNDDMQNVSEAQERMHSSFDARGRAAVGMAISAPGALFACPPGPFPSSTSEPGVALAILYSDCGRVIASILESPYLLKNIDLGYTTCVVSKTNEVNIASFLSRCEVTGFNPTLADGDILQGAFRSVYGDFLSSSRLHASFVVSRYDFLELIFTVAQLVILPLSSSHYSAVCNAVASFSSEFASFSYSARSELKSLAIILEILCSSSIELSDEITACLSKHLSESGRDAIAASGNPQQNRKNRASESLTDIMTLLIHCPVLSFSASPWDVVDILTPYRDLAVDILAEGRSNRGFASPQAASASEISLAIVFREFCKRFGVDVSSLTTFFKRFFVPSVPNTGAAVTFLEEQEKTRGADVITYTAPLVMKEAFKKALNSDFFPLFLHERCISLLRENRELLLWEFARCIGGREGNNLRTKEAIIDTVFPVAPLPTLYEMNQRFVRQSESSSAGGAISFSQLVSWTKKAGPNCSLARITHCYTDTVLLAGSVPRSDSTSILRRRKISMTFSMFVVFCVRFFAHSDEEEGVNYEGVAITIDTFMKNVRHMILRFSDDLTRVQQKLEVRVIRPFLSRRQYLTPPASLNLPTQSRGKIETVLGEAGLLAEYIIRVYSKDCCSICSDDPPISLLQSPRVWPPRPPTLLLDAPRFVDFCKALGLLAGPAYADSSVAAWRAYGRFLMASVPPSSGIEMALAAAVPPSPVKFSPANVVDLLLDLARDHIMYLQHRDQHDSVTTTESRSLGSDLDVDLLYRFVRDQMLLPVAIAIADVETACLSGTSTIPSLHESREEASRFASVGRSLEDIMRYGGNRFMKELHRVRNWVTVIFNNLAKEYMRMEPLDKACVDDASVLSDVQKEVPISMALDYLSCNYLLISETACSMAARASLHPRTDRKRRRDEEKTLSCCCEYNYATTVEEPSTGLSPDDLPSSSTTPLQMSCPICQDFMLSRLEFEELLIRCAMVAWEASGCLRGDGANAGELLMDVTVTDPQRRSSLSSRHIALPVDDINTSKEAFRAAASAVVDVYCKACVTCKSDQDSLVISSRDITTLWGQNFLAPFIRTLWAIDESSKRAVKEILSATPTPSMPTSSSKPTSHNPNVTPSGITVGNIRLPYASPVLRKLEGEFSTLVKDERVLTRSGELLDSILAQRSSEGVLVDHARSSPRRGDNFVLLTMNENRAEVVKQQLPSLSFADPVLDPVSSHDEINSAYRSASMDNFHKMIEKNATASLDLLARIRQRSEKRFLQPDDISMLSNQDSNVLEQSPYDENMATHKSLSQLSSASLDETISRQGEAEATEAGDIKIPKVHEAITKLLEEAKESLWPVYATYCSCGDSYDPGKLSGPNLFSLLSKLGLLTSDTVLSDIGVLMQQIAPSRMNGTSSSVSSASLTPTHVPSHRVDGPPLTAGSKAPSLSFEEFLVFLCAFSELRCEGVVAVSLVNHDKSSSSSSAVALADLSSGSTSPIFRRKKLKSPLLSSTDSLSKSRTHHVRLRFNDYQAASPAFHSLLENSILPILRKQVLLAFPEDARQRDRYRVVFTAEVLAALERMEGRLIQSFESQHTHRSGHLNPEPIDTTLDVNTILSALRKINLVPRVMSEAQILQLTRDVLPTHEGGIKSGGTLTFPQWEWVLVTIAVEAVQIAVAESSTVTRAERIPSLVSDLIASIAKVISL